jgi:hypothetical protein
MNNVFREHRLVFLHSPEQLPESFDAAPESMPDIREKITEKTRELEGVTEQAQAIAEQTGDVEWAQRVGAQKAMIEMQLRQLEEEVVREVAEEEGR